MCCIAFDLVASSGKASCSLFLDHVAPLELELKAWANLDPEEWSNTEPETVNNSEPDVDSPSELKEAPVGESISVRSSSD